MILLPEYTLVFASKPSNGCSTDLPYTDLQFQLLIVSRPCTRQIAKASNQVAVLVSINSVSSIKLREFCTWFHWGQNWVAVCHLELVQDPLGIPFLGHKNSFLTLFDFQAKEVLHQFDVCHLKLLCHYVLEFLNHLSIVPHEYKVIYIKSNKHYITFIFLYVQSMFIWTLFISFLLKVLVNVIILCLRSLLQPIKRFLQP